MLTPEMIKQANSNSGTSMSQKFDPNATTLPRTLGTTPTLGSEITDQAKSGLEQIKEGISGGGLPSAVGLNVPKNIESGLEVGSGLVTLLYSPLAPIFKPINDAIQVISDKVGNIKSLQDFTQAHPEATDIITRVSTDLANLGNIVGTAAGVAEGVKVAPKIAGAAEEGLDKITTPGETPSGGSGGSGGDLTTARAEGIYKTQDIGENIKDEMYNKLLKDPIKKIEETNPEAKLDLGGFGKKGEATIWDKLISLKEGKNFQLPDSIFSNKGLLSPTETLDLISRLNKKVFTEAADGTLKVDQSGIKLANELKDLAVS